MPGAILYDVKKKHKKLLKILAKTLKFEIVFVSDKALEKFEDYVFGKLMDEARSKERKLTKKSSSELEK